jgi:hypothetical protein
MVVLKEEIDDNVVVMKYLQLGSMLNGISNEQIITLIRYIEEYYIDEADNELGEFLDEMTKIYLTLLNNDELHMYIRECIYEFDLNLEMLYHIGLHLEDVVQQKIIA